MSLIKCSNVSLSYESHKVITDLSFEVNEGDYLCVVGENGSGKSTLIKALLGLKKINGGTIEFGDGLQRNEIGYIPQQTEIQKDFPATVNEVVRSGLINSMQRRFFYNKSDAKKAESIMNELGINDIKNRSYRELSGGQQQRVLLARALCATKKLILLDEPAAGLDPVITNQLYHLIEHLNKDKKITVIMVSHDIAASVKYSTHMLHIHKDKPYFGDTEHYLNCDDCRSLAQCDQCCCEEEEK